MLAALEDWVRTPTQLDVWRLVDTSSRGREVMPGGKLLLVRHRLLRGD